MSLETENILEPFKMDPFVLKAGHLDDNPNIFMTVFLGRFLIVVSLVLLH